MMPAPPEPRSPTKKLICGNCGRNILPVLITAKAAEIPCTCGRHYRVKRRTLQEAFERELSDTLVIGKGNAANKRGGHHVDA